MGLQPQDKVIFQIDANNEFITALWACFLGGLVPVPLTVAPAYEANPAVIAKLQGVWDMLERPLVLSSTALIEPLKQAATQNHWRDFRVTTLANLKDSKSLAAVYPAQPEDLALLLLTSGSTGLPKGVMLNHGNLLSMTAGTTQMNGFTEAVVALNWMPLDHVGSIVSIGLLAVDLGCHQIFVPTEYILQQPLRLLELIERHRVTMSWAPNFAFALINQQLKELRGRRYQLSSLRFLVNAGEQIAIKTVREFLQLLQAHGMPADALRPAFGMSETCSGISYSAGLTLPELRDENPFLPLGQPIPGATLRIVDDHQQVLATGDIGRLQVKGPSVTCGYYRNPERNREAFTADSWFTTGDLGYFRYNQNAPGFQLGPLDLTIGTGELIYNTGGNGSGKSTFLKVLTGLYSPSQGQLFVDEQPISEENLPTYRELFAVIFSDFHLFDRLYGLDTVAPERVRELLAMMEIDDKTDFMDGKFTNLQLSTGQRKRLAMVVALLQDCPIYIFDEWAADQDPVFRERYYHEILPQLQQQGKTIVAVTHDDRYFHLADRHIRFDLGRVDLTT